LLDRGQVKAEGETRSILAEYYGGRENQTAGSRDLTECGRTGDFRPIMSRVTLSNGHSNLDPISHVRMGSSLSIHVEFDGEGTPIEPVLGVVIKTHLGSPVFGVNNLFIPGFEFGNVKAGGTIACHLDQLPLMPGTYLVDLYLTTAGLGAQGRNL